MTNKEFKSFVEKSLYNESYSDRLSDIKNHFKDLCHDYYNSNLFVYTQEEYLDFLDEILSEFPKDTEAKYIENIEKEKEYASDYKVIIALKNEDYCYYLS